MFHLADAPELDDFCGNELNQLVKQTSRFDFSFPAEINQLAVDTVTRGTPAIFIEQSPPINAEGRILSKQFVKLGNDRLDECGHGQGVVNP